MEAKYHVGLAAGHAAGKGEVRMGRLSYDTEERHRIEGGGTVCGKKMLLKIVSLAADPDAAAN